MFTRSAATVSFSVSPPLPLSTSILSEPLAGAFNRHWHLSPRAVMSLIHQQGMTGRMPLHSRTHTSPTWKGGEASRSAIWVCLSVCMWPAGEVQVYVHGHWIWTLNHQGQVCVSSWSLHRVWGYWEGVCRTGEGKDTLGYPLWRMFHRKATLSTNAVIDSGLWFWRFLPRIDTSPSPPETPMWKYRCRRSLKCQRLENFTMSCKKE